MSIENIEKKSRGTEVILHVKTGEDDFLNDWRLRNIIKKYSDHINLPIMMHKIEPLMDEKKDAPPKPVEWETVNRATALWTGESGVSA